MADQRSVETLAFNFASRTFSYKRPAQGLSSSVSVFSSFMLEHLDPNVKTDQCAQYMDDIGIAVGNVPKLTQNIRAVFRYIRPAGLKLKLEKNHFAVRQVEILGRTIFLGKICDKRVMSKTTKSSTQSNFLMRYSGDWTENLENTQELPRQSLLTEKNNISKKWLNWSGSGSCHVNSVSEDDELIVSSPSLHCKTLMRTLLRQKTPCNLNWSRNYLRPVAMNNLWQPWTCSLAISMPTRHLIETLKQLLKIKLP